VNRSEPATKSQSALQPCTAITKTRISRSNPLSMLLFEATKSIELERCKELSAMAPIANLLFAPLPYQSSSLDILLSSIWHITIFNGVLCVSLLAFLYYI